MHPVISWLTPIFVSVVAFFAPIHTLLTVVFSLITLDLVTGIAAACKRGEVIRSAGIRRTVSKLFIFELAILIGFLLQYVTKDMLPVANLVASVIAIGEAKSLFENLGSIYGENVFKGILDKIGSINDKQNKKE